MSDANKALAEVRGWLCDNLSSGDAGKVCGMLSVVSRRINEIEDENGKLRELLSMYMTFARTVARGLIIQSAYPEGMGRKLNENEMRERAMELGIEWCR